MGYVVAFALAVFLGGLLFLGLLSVRAFRQVKALGRTVADASARIAEANATLETLKPRER